MLNRWGNSFLITVTLSRLWTLGAPELLGPLVLCPAVKVIFNLIEHCLVLVLVQVTSYKTMTGHMKVLLKTI